MPQRTPDRRKMSKFETSDARRFPLALRFAGVALLAAISAAANCSAADWLQFRNNGNVADDNARLPRSWSVEEGKWKNIAWRSDLPGRGPSSPIVVDGRIIVTSSGGVHQDRLYVLSFDAASGEEQWRREFWATGRTSTHPTSAVAAPTPASDGSRIFAFYSSNDLVCLDLEGQLLWYRGLSHDYPKSGNDIGMSASPIVVDGAVIVQVECQGDSFAAAVEAETGETRWRVPRSPLASWCSPTVVPMSGGGQAVVLQSTDVLTAHDSSTGEVRWRYESVNSGIPSTLATRGRVYLPSDGLTALDIASSGEPQKLWSSAQLGPGASTPVLYRGRLYSIGNSGVLACADAETGQAAWDKKLRLGGRFWATPAAVDGHLYCFNSDGQASLVKLGDDAGEIVFQMEFGVSVQASPAIVDNALYVRTDRHLWKIAEQP